MGRFVHGVFCAMAQMELDVISERTKAGMMAAKNKRTFQRQETKRE